MNIYMIIEQYEGNWVMSAVLFDNQEAAIAWAEANKVGKTWRLVMISSVAITQ